MHIMPLDGIIIKINNEDDALMINGPINQSIDGNSHSMKPGIAYRRILHHVAASTVASIV